MERRLAAILAADVVGYTRLMGADEMGTLERLKALRRDLVAPSIAKRKGRIVKLLGDGLLAACLDEVEGRIDCEDTERAVAAMDRLAGGKSLMA